MLVQMEIVLREQQNFVACSNKLIARKGSDMNKQALVISKDLVNELKRLAVLATKDDEALEEARKRYVRAGEAVVSSSSAFAIALYDFVLRYAEQPELVEGKLSELNIQFKRTSSVYVKIARLAFDDVQDEKGEVSRTRVSRYASIVEAAHSAGLTAEQFKKTVANGVTQALRKLRGFGKEPQSDALELGREIASSLVGKRTFAIDQFPLPEDVVDGDELELVARVEGGKLVVYGVVPPSASNVRNVLSKLGTPSKTQASHLGALLPDILRTIKLVTGTKDTDTKASYDIQGDLVRFAVFGSTADAVLTGPASLAGFGTDALVLKVTEWRRIIETLNPLRKHISDVAFANGEITVEFDEKAVPDVDDWFEANSKPKKIGTSKGAVLNIKADADQIEHDYLATVSWQDVATFTEIEIKPLLSFKPTKKYVAVETVNGGVSLSTSEKPLNGHINFERKPLSALQGAAKKMLRLSKELRVESSEGYLRLTASYGDGLELSLIVPAV